MKIIVNTRVIDFSLKHSSNFLKKQLKTQNGTNARDDHLIN